MVAHGSRHWDDFGRVFFFYPPQCIKRGTWELGGGTCVFPFSLMVTVWIFYFIIILTVYWAFYFTFLENTVTTSEISAVQNITFSHLPICILSFWFYIFILLCFCLIGAKCFIFGGHPTHPSTSDAPPLFPYTHTHIQTHSQWSNPLH